MLQDGVPIDVPIPLPNPSQVFGHQHTQPAELRELIARQH
jgi:hypothetical protein